MEKNSARKRSRATSAKSSTQGAFATREQVDNHDVGSANAKGIVYGTRVAIIGVSVVAALFCALFWPSVLDFRAKIARVQSADNDVQTPSESDETREEVVDVADDWRDRLDALYPREVFSPTSDSRDFDETVFSTPASDRAVARASRFNGFEPGSLPFADATRDPSAKDATSVESSRVDASRSDSFASFLPEGDAPFPVDPSVPRASYAYATQAEEETTTNQTEELSAGDNPLLAELAPVDPNDPLGLDPLFQESSPTIASHVDSEFSFPETRAPQSAIFRPSAPVASPSSKEAPSAIDSGVSVARYDAVANPTAGDFETTQNASASQNVASASLDAQLPVAQITGDFETTQNAGASQNVASASLDAQLPVAQTTGNLETTQNASASQNVASASLDDPFPVAQITGDLESKSSDALTQIAEITEEPEILGEETSTTHEDLSVVEAAFEPSYFSRAAGLYGGQKAFSSLYLATAAKIVSNSSAWSPGSFSRVTPILLSDAIAPTMETIPQPPTPRVEETPSLESETLTRDYDRVSAEATAAKYPTLVGYVERTTIKSPEPLPSVKGASADALDVVGD